MKTYNKTDLGKFEVLQTVEHNKQGYYLLCKNMRLRGSFGPVLVKYLGVSADVATEIRLAEDKKNQEREITFARELVHENIVRILGFISSNGCPDSINAIIMEGDFDGPLEVCKFLTALSHQSNSYASRKQITLPLVKAFALQLASALKYCHFLDIMHRDVRARNIYVQDEKRIKLGNFGYARVRDKDNIHTSNKGEELYYRAPEMISNHATTEYTVSVDVYGFALVLWSILHGGEKPYKDDPACEKLVRNETRFKQHLQEGNRPRIDDNVDQGLIKLIEECWINETEFNKSPSMSNVVLTLQNM